MLKGIRNLTLLTSLNYSTTGEHFAVLGYYKLRINLSEIGSLPKSVYINFHHHPGLLSIVLSGHDRSAADAVLCKSMLTKEYHNIVSALTPLRNFN